MPDYVFFLGAHPELSYAELEAVIGTKGALRPFAPLPLCVAKCEELLDDSLFDRLGGCERVSIVLGSQASAWDAAGITKLLSPLPRKFWLGLGTFEPSQKIDSLLFAIKEKVAAAGSKMKFVLPSSRKGPEGKVLNAAQVIFNKLDRSPNAEVITFEFESEHYAVKTIWIQDIQSYEVRDTSRPARSGTVGMLPPKLAQVMINLAIGEASQTRVLDPFCGMGTVLQEGQLMGLEMVGSDSAPAMVSASEANLKHLAEHFNVSEDPTPKVFHHDATQPFPKDFGFFDAVVTEPDLGPPLRASLPHSEVMKRQMQLGQKYRQAFGHFGEVLKPGGRVVFLLPAFAQRRGADFLFMPEAFLDGIEKSGYRKIQPTEASDRLVYARPDAWVGREITIWERL